MEIVSGDKFFPVQPPATPDYRANNPLARIMSHLQSCELASERENYLLNKVQYLLPLSQLEFYGPSDQTWNESDIKSQNNKEDFQKQNVRDFLLADIRLARGWASAGDWTGPFISVSYRGGPDSALSKATGHNLGNRIKAFVKIRDNQPQALLDMPYNPRTDRYELEIWGYPGNDLYSNLDKRGREALARGQIIARPDLVPGTYEDFAREGLDNTNLLALKTYHTMHPILPLPLEVAFANPDLTVWDSNGGKNYQYTFGMLYRGWDNYLQVGVSQSPHGGFGFLHYRNVLSNYFAFKNSGELGRDIAPWMFDANGQKAPTERREKFLAVDYMDLHILKPDCGIGLHRHRDNQEIFFMMQGIGIMVVADWCKISGRERAFEIRTLEPGCFTLLKPGQLHALFNVTDEDLSLLMFGGYD